MLSREFSAGPFSFTYLLYAREYYSTVGASFARDIAEKTLTSVNENRDRNRKLNSPEFSEN